MADKYEPPGARAAIAKAAQLRAQYAGAVEVVQQDRTLSKDEKRQRLQMLHVAHQQNMDDLRRLRHQAHREASRQAVRDLAADDAAAPSAQRADLYQQSLERAMAMDVPDLIRSYDLAELIGNHLGMRAVAVAAMTKRGPLPGDPAENLVARFASARIPDGSGGSRSWFPKAAMAWERLQDLEGWERQDHMAADAAFSVAATPAKPDDPRRQDPTEAARDDVAQLYNNGSPTRASTAGGGGEPATP
jgi:hypothetical protein